MRKRILSLLLALTLALSAGVFGVIPALAADSCVSVKADAVTTGEVVAGSLLEIPMQNLSNGTTLFVDWVWSKERAQGLAARRFVQILRDSAVR